MTRRPNRPKSPLLKRDEYVAAILFPGVSYEEIIMWGDQRMLDAMSAITEYIAKHNIATAQFM